MTDSRKEKAIAALLVQPTIKKAAEAAGICERTMYVYLDDPEFKREYIERRRKMLEAACGVLASFTGNAIAALGEIVADKRASKLARVNAARTILEYTMKTFEDLDLAARIEALENAPKSNNLHVPTEFWEDER